MTAAHADDLHANRQLARRWVEAFNREDVDAFDGLLSPDYRYHVGDWQLEGIEAAKTHARGIAEVWNPHRFSILDEVAEGDRVCLRLEAEDTHTGEHAGIPATGRSVRFEVMIIFRVADGRIAEGWRTGNDLHRIRQIGGRVVAGDG